MVVFEQVKKEDVEKLLKHGFIKEPNKTIYEELRLKKANVTAVLYTSGKLVLQGKKEAVESAEKLISAKKMGEKVKTKNYVKESGWVIGTDESLKGDTFGGLTVAGVKADDELREKLKEIGVADSKTLSDHEILPLAVKIRKIASCVVYNILPEEYNKKGKITLLLNEYHRKCFEDLKPGKHVVDLYPGCTVGDIQETKAESKYVEVAAASILARAEALQQLSYLSKEAGFNLPKGSTHVQLALFELKQRKLDFKKFTKIDFANVVGYLAKE